METIIRGTTPSLAFALPFEAALVSDFFLTFKQAENEKYTLDKSIKDAAVYSKTVVISLSQTDTLKLYPGVCEMQVRLKAEGELYASPVMRIKIADVLKNEVIE